MNYSKLLQQIIPLTCVAFLVSCGSSQNTPEIEPPAVVPTTPLAFPGASGGGAGSIGGRGGIVYEVTNLNDSGPGSLREALEASGARTVVFKVGGTIVLESSIEIDDPYLTIAGQTAPGDGILIRSGENVQYSAIEIKNGAHDVIIRYLRIRPHGVNTNVHEGAIAIANNTHDIIIDHCSLSWATGKNLNIWSDENPIYNLTVSWNIIAEGSSYRDHSCGLLTGSNVDAEGMVDFSIHHNLFVHNNNRNPLLKVKSADLINNIIYGWGWWATGLSGGIEVDIVGNKYVRQASVNTGTHRNDILWMPPKDGTADQGAPGQPSIYFDGNLGSRTGDDNPNSWDSMLEQVADEDWGWPLINGVATKTILTQDYRRFAPRSRAYPIVIDEVSSLEEVLLAPSGVGASRQLDDNGSWQPNRDSVDQRIINEYRDGIGFIPADVSEVGGYPIMEDGTPYQDTDHDGMADIWELEQGLNPNDGSDRNGFGVSQNGYTNLEMFLNGI